MAGKTSWTAGIYRRSRWATASLYAAMSKHNEEVCSGKEAARRANRADKRDKDHLIPVKRFETARAWLVALFTRAPPTTRRSLWDLPENAVVTTDASPQGCGGVLAVRPDQEASWQILEAYEYGLNPDDAELLEVELTHRGQSYLETLAVWLALRTWKDLLKNIKVALGFRTDSTVALAIMDKSASSSAALNRLAAELALLLEELHINDLRLQHVPGKLNKLADYLSRPKTRSAERPDLLKEVKHRTPPKIRAEDFILQWPKATQGTEALYSGAWESLTA